MELSWNWNGYGISVLHVALKTFLLKAYFKCPLT